MLPWSFCYFPNFEELVGTFQKNTAGIFETLSHPALTTV